MRHLLMGLRSRFSCWNTGVCCTEGSMEREREQRRLKIEEWSAKSEEWREKSED